MKVSNVASSSYANVEVTRSKFKVGVSKNDQNIQPKITEIYRTTTDWSSLRSFVVLTEGRGVQNERCLIGLREFGNPHCFCTVFIVHGRAGFFLDIPDVSIC